LHFLFENAEPEAKMIHLYREDWQDTK